MQTVTMPAPRALLRAMSDYLAAQNSISFQFDSTLEVVTTDKQKLGFASSGTVDLSRPDKIRATRHGGFANVELTFDGKTVTVLGKDLNSLPRPSSRNSRQSGEGPP